MAKYELLNIGLSTFLLLIVEELKIFASISKHVIRNIVIINVSRNYEMCS